MTHINDMETQSIVRISKPRQMRLNVPEGTSTADILRFYQLVIRPFRVSLIDAVQVMEQSAIPLIAWLSGSQYSGDWAWHKELQPAPPMKSTRYSRDDSLQQDLQDEKFKVAFECSFRLWNEYQGVFLTVLMLPLTAGALCSKAINVFNSNAFTADELMEFSRLLYTCLTSPSNLYSWKNAQCHTK